MNSPGRSAPDDRQVAAPIGFGVSKQNNGLTCPTGKKLPVECNEEICGLSNGKFVGSISEQPAPAAARRVDLNGQWSRARWDWKRAVRKDRSLSDGAKLLAAALCDDFAHHETGFCNPAVETLADALGKSARQVQRALAELRDEQWIAIRYAEGRGKRSDISFLSGQGEAAFSTSESVRHMASQDRKGVSHLSPIRERSAEERVTDLARKGDRYVTPFKDKPNSNQKESARADAPPAEPVLVRIERGSHHEAAWNEWLAAGRWPTLCQLDRRAGDGWAVPSRLPPRDGDWLEARIAEKWASRACSTMQARGAA